MFLTTYAEDRALVLKKMQSEKRIALIIGNADYVSTPLKNPVNDARLMDSTLRELGFKTIKIENATQKKMKQAIDDFGRQIKNGGVGLFYYAGHGIQVNGRNYLVPVNAKIDTEADVEYESVDSGRVLAKMESANNRLNIVFLDACRNNPFARSFRSGDKGLARLDAPRGTFVAYATAPGSVASDGNGRNGLFTSELVKAIKSPNVKIEDVIKIVRNRVYSSTGGKQIPWSSSSLMGDFYFKLLASKTDIQMPSDVGFSLDDLQQKDKELAENERKAKSAWGYKLNEMSLAFSKVKNYETSTKINGNKVAAWQKFKKSFNDDNPYTTKDEEMRNYADKRISVLENQVAVTKNAEPKNNTKSYLKAEYLLDGDANDSKGMFNGKAYGGGGCSDIKNYNMGAYCFSGSDYIELPSAVKIFGGNPREWSVSAWFRTDSTEYAQSIVNDYYSSGWDGQFGLAVTLLENGRIQFAIRKTDYSDPKQDNGHVAYQVLSNKHIQSNKWYNIIASASKETGMLYLYLNGQLEGTADFDISYNYLGDDPIRISSSKFRGNTHIPFHGAIDNVLFFDRVLNQKEASEIYYSDK